MLPGNTRCLTARHLQSPAPGLMDRHITAVHAHRQHPTVTMGTQVHQKACCLPERDHCTQCTKRPKTGGLVSHVHVTGLLLQALMHQLADAAPTACHATSLAQTQLKSCRSISTSLRLNGSGSHGSL